jgi:hypothetical protein
MHCAPVTGYLVGIRLAPAVSLCQANVKTPPINDWRDCIVAAMFGEERRAYQDAGRAVAYHHDRSDFRNSSSDKICIVPFGNVSLNFGCGWHSLSVLIRDMVNLGPKCINASHTKNRALGFETRC